MKVTITEAAAKILAQPHVPVMLLDTCVFIDLFRGDTDRIAAVSAKANRRLQEPVHVGVHSGAAAPDQRFVLVQ